MQRIHIRCPQCGTEKILRRFGVGYLELDMSCDKCKAKMEAVVKPAKEPIEEPIQKGEIKTAKRPKKKGKK